MRLIKNKTFRPRKRRIYSPKKYSNPYFQKKKKKRVRSLLPVFSWRYKLIFIGIIIIVIFLVWLLLFSTFFNIRYINVNIDSQANKKLPPSVRINKEDITEMAWQQVKTLILGVVPQGNLFLFNKNKLINTLNENYYLSTLSIKKNIPHTLLIEIEEMDYAMIWHEDDKYYYIDIEGNIITEVNPLEIQPKQYPLVDSLGDGKIAGDKVNADEYLLFVVDLFGNARDSLENINIERFIIDKDLNTVKMAIAEGPFIYFNTKEDIIKQINKLIVIINEKLKEDLKSKTYIDLRYGDRVYYR